MIYQVTLKSTFAPVMKFVVAPTIDICYNHFRNSDRKILSVSEMDYELILNNKETQVCYIVFLLDSHTNHRHKYIIFDTFSNVINWIYQQQEVEVESVSRQFRELVILE